MLNLPSQNKIHAAINHRGLLIGFLLLFALLLNREGDRLPAGNEFVYLLYFYKAWHPKYLATDWTFQETTAGHAIFNCTLGWLTLLMPLTIAAWVGRVGSWVATFIGLFRVGRHYKIPPWAVAVGIWLWMLQRQSPVTADWMIGTFEAKVIAYPCLLFAIDAALSGRNLLAGVLCGVAFSYHTAIGMWGGAALGLAVLTYNSPRKTLQFTGAAILFSLPGVITSWELVLGPHAISFAEAKYLVTVALPDCNDAAAFSHTQVALLLILPIFTILHARWRAGDRQIRQLMVFDVALAVFFAFGIFARVIGRYDWILLFPMRVYAVFALLLFFWQAQTVLIALVERRPIPRPLWASCLLIFLLMPSPVLQLRDMIDTHLQRYLRPMQNAEVSPRGNDADFITVARWVSQNTPPTDVVIAPPWPNDGFYYIQRPLIANWHAPRYDRMTDWKNRIEALVGDTSHLNYEDSLQGEMDLRAWSHYANLSPEEIERIRHDLRDAASSVPWGGQWLITTGQYPSYRLAFDANSYRVYQLP